MAAQQNGALDLAELLQQSRKGQREASAQLLPLLERELRVRTVAHLTGPPANDTLLPSAVLREAYENVAKHDGATPQDKAWFHTLGAALIRRILEEHANGATAASVYLALDGELTKPLDFAAFNEALQRFGLAHPRESAVVEMKIFGGMNAREIAEVLAVPQDTVKRDWSFAKASIKRDLTRESPAASLPRCSS